MDWKAWVNHKAGRTKLSIEEAEQYVTELILSRSIPASFRDGNEEFLCNPASLRSISRSRRVMQTLGMIVKSRHLEHYYQAIYLLQFLHNLYPDAIPLQDYGKLLVYLKIEAVIYTGCCVVLSNRIQATQYLIKQFFDDYKCEGYSGPDKEHLESLHSDGRVKLTQILGAGEELHSSNLSMDHFSSLKDHETMCTILGRFFKGIDDILPPPTIIQIIQEYQDSQEQKLSQEIGSLTSNYSQEQKLSQEIGSLTSNYVTRLVIPTQALTKRKPPTSSITPSKTAHSSKTTDSPMIETNLPSTSISNIGHPSEEMAASNDAHESTQSAIFQTATSNNTSTEESESEIVNLLASPNFEHSPPKMTPLSPRMASDSSQSQEISSLLTRENAGSNNEDNSVCKLKFISTHSRIKRTPLSSKQFVPLVRGMRCRKSLKGPFEEQVFNGGMVQPKIKRVRIVLSSLTKEECMHHLKLADNKTDQVKTPPLQKKSPHCKEADSSSALTLSSSVSNGFPSSSDEDYEPPDMSDKDDTSTAARTRGKRKSLPPVRYVPSDEGYKRDPQTKREQIVTRAQKKRKSVPPVKYAPFVHTSFQRDTCSRERSHTPDSESVISESVTSSVGPDSPLVNLHT